MDTSILIFAIFGFILWLDNKRRNIRIKKMLEEVSTQKPISTRTSNASEYVIKRRNLRELVEYKLSILGYDITPDNGDFPDKTDVDEIISNVLSTYSIVAEPTSDEVVEKILSILEKTPVKDKSKNTEIVPQDTIDNIVDKLIGETPVERKHVDNTIAIDDAIVALSKLGYKKPAIARAIAVVIRGIDTELSPEYIVKQSLNILNK